MSNEVSDEKKHTPAISVVIPMYNCEQFVSELLTMFANQTFKDFEVICVIDGATDGTEAAVKDFCETDERFRYVVRENGGAGAARNTGIDGSKGKYVVFPDADDVFEKDFLLKLYEAAEKNRAQMALCGAVTYDYLAKEKRNIYGFNKFELIEGEVYSSKYKKHLMKMIDTSNQNKMFLLDFIKTKEIRFSETPASNDLFFSKAIIALAERIVVVHDDLVTIRRHINPNSISSDRKKYSHIALTELQKFYKWMKDKDIIGAYISDYIWMFDVTANYEMKNGINPLFAEQMANILNNEEPWKKLSGSQIMKALTESFGDNGREREKTTANENAAGEIKEIDRKNSIIKERNRCRACMQEMIKKRSVESFDRDLDDSGSKAELQKSEILNGSAVDNSFIIENRLKGHLTMPEISVIIPMYNCAEFIREVLPMFSDQVFSDFEVICVIDGATDRTEELVKDYCEKDSRFSYIYKQNGGPGSARNVGMDLARGRYIVFSDVDDEYSEDYLAKLYKASVKHNAQITNCMFSMCSSIKSKNIDENGFDTKFFIENVVYSHKGIDNLFTRIESRVSNKMFNMRFIREKNIRFPETRLSEDSFFSHAALSVADRIIVIEDNIFKYRYRLRPGALSNNVAKYIKDVPEVLRLLYKWLKEHSLIDIHGNDYYYRVKNALYYYGSMNVPSVFAYEMSHLLNAEEPWDKKTSGEILSYMREGILAEYAVKKERELKKNDSKTIEADKELCFLLNFYRNRIRTAELIRKVSMERYGRDFERKDSLPTDSALT